VLLQAGARSVSLVPTARSGAGNKNNMVLYAFANNDGFRPNRLYVR
jgi:hypothetical protein